MTAAKKKIAAQPSGPPSSNRDFTLAARDAVLNRVEQDYEESKKTRTFRYPTWLYGPIKK
jgi:biuret amidohydrolase